MDQFALFLLLALGVGTTTAMLFVALALFFGDFLRGVQDAAEANPGRAPLVGLVNTLFFVAIGYLFITWAQSTGVGLLGVVGLLIGLLLILGLLFGLTGMVLVARERLWPEAEGWRSIAGAGAILIMACLAPYLGWFGLTPYLLFRGVGGVVLHLAARYRARRIEPA